MSRDRPAHNSEEVISMNVTTDMTPSAYWATCAKEWHHVAEGAHEGGALGAEIFYEELSDDADYFRHLLDD